MTARVWIWFSESGNNIRKWHREPFEEGQEFVLASRLEALEAENARLREALTNLRHAVFGDTGFANAVRIDSGKAYPWPALDEADKISCAALSNQPTASLKIGAPETWGEWERAQQENERGQ